MEIKDMLAFAHLEGMTEVELLKKLEDTKHQLEDDLNDAMHVAATGKGLSRVELEQRKDWARESIHEGQFMLQAITTRLTGIHLASA
jgi:hypothetical protein